MMPRHRIWAEGKFPHRRFAGFERRWSQASTRRRLRWFFDLGKCTGRLGVARQNQGSRRSSPVRPASTAGADEQGQRLVPVAFGASSRSSVRRFQEKTKGSRSGETTRILRSEAQKVEGITGDGRFTRRSFGSSADLLEASEHEIGAGLKR